MLTLTAQRIDYHHAELDCNALNFVLSEGYFSLQRSLFIDAEDDPIFALPYFMLASPELGEDGNYNTINEVKVFMDRLQFAFAQPILAEQYDICVILPTPLDVTLLEFLVNHLFLGEAVTYGDDVPSAWHRQQTDFQECLD